MASLNPVSGALGRKAAAHLLRRATFGPRKRDITQFAAYSADQAISQLFQAVPLPTAPPPTPPPNDEREVSDTLKQEYFLGWLLERQRVSGLSSIEKLTFFLHTHFTTIRTVVDQSQALYYQNLLLRRYALGSLKELALKICTDNAMLLLLDGGLNIAGSPNENYAREFFELYTIGKGPQLAGDNFTNYTEKDIQEAARVFSGYKFDEEYSNLDPTTNLPRGIFKPSEHDSEVKTFSSVFRNRTIASGGAGGQLSEAAALDELKQLVDMIFEQPETARHLCRKIYRFFVYYEITEEIERDIIVPLGALLQSSDYQIRPVLEKLFRSQHFYDLDNGVNTDDTRGAIIKSPLDLVLGTLRYFNLQPPDAADLITFYEKTYRDGILSTLEDQGMIFYDPYDVAGYDAYHQAPVYNRNWISANFLARRYQFAALLIEGMNKNGDPMGFQLDIIQHVRDSQNITDPRNPEQLVRELVDHLLPEIISTERFNYFYQEVLLDTLSVMNWQVEWNNYLSTGNDTNVRMQLERLMNALLQSPEYQLM